MKASILASGTYVCDHPLQMPSPPAKFDPEVGPHAFREILEQAELADSLGFDFISVSEHHYAPYILQPNPLLMAAAISQRIERAHVALLGPLLPLNNPVKVAEEIAMLDNLTNGRLIVLFLRGAPNEFSTYFTNPDDTKAITKEAAFLIKRALTEPQPFGWEGGFFRFRRVSVWPGVVQRPHPPLYWSGNSMDSAEFAAQHGYGFTSTYPPAMVPQLVARYRSTAAEHGWEPTQDQVLCRQIVVVAETDKEAQRMGHKLLEVVPPSNILRMQAMAQGKEPPPDLDTTGLGAPSFPGLCGSPDTVVEQIRVLHETAENGIIDFVPSIGNFSLDFVRRSIGLLGSEVLPRIRDFGVPDRGTEPARV